MPTKKNAYIVIFFKSSCGKYIYELKFFLTGKAKWTDPVAIFICVSQNSPVVFTFRIDSEISFPSLCLNFNESLFRVLIEISIDRWLGCLILPLTKHVAVSSDRNEDSHIEFN